MRSLDDTRRKWETLFSDHTIGLDLRQAVKEPDGFNPCEDGLRSICWKAFLLCGPVSQSSWPKKLSESRSAYTSLRDHFLRFIEHPDDLQSNVDPLADDNNSPWASLRQDEVNRAEIFQDVERCLQDNFFFREPSTQRKLLDILFIYSKLHPDVGYRQGMHELLAPILWVVERDSIDPKTNKTSQKKDEKDSLMLQSLDAAYVEHDAFSLFCAVMQTTKSFYEMGESNSSSAIVSRSARINDELLAKVDPELAEHLHAIEVLPQIYLIRWIRLLFGREFAFDDVLAIWDLLFAENLNLALIDTTCIAMLLRIRWKLMAADYSTALTLLLRYPSPVEPFGPVTLVRDAIYLEKEKSIEAAATLVGRYTGRQPQIQVRNSSSKGYKLGTPPRQQQQHRHTLSSASQESLSRTSRSPARFQQYQKGLESAFQEVSGNLQRRTEGWNISKTVRGAVGEIKRNIDSIQSAGNSPRRSADVGRDSLGFGSTTPNLDDPSKRLKVLEDRNKALAKMLADTIEELRANQTDAATEDPRPTDGSLNIALAKLQFVQVYLEDSEIPIPPPMPDIPLIKEEEKVVQDQPTAADDAPQAVLSTPQKEAERAESVVNTELETGKPAIESSIDTSIGSLDPAPRRLHPRPSLAQSSFSWMLGENRHRSSFVSSISAPPEERRGSDARTRPKPLFNDTKKEEERKGSDSSVDDGFTMSSLRGRPPEM